MTVLRYVDERWGDPHRIVLTVINYIDTYTLTYTHTLHRHIHIHTSTYTHIRYTYHPIWFTDSRFLHLLDTIHYMLLESAGIVYWSLVILINSMQSITNGGVIFTSQL